MKSKFTIQIIILIIITIILGACSGKKENTNIDAPAGMLSLDLSSYGKPFTIFIPDTNSARLMITEVSTGALQIKVGDHFGITIHEQLADLSLLKQDLKSDEVNKLKAMIKEEPDGLIWESEVVRPEYHFILNQKIENNEYSFEDLRDNQANPYNKDDITRMFEAGKSIQSVKKSTNS